MRFLLTALFITLLSWNVIATEQAWTKLEGTSGKPGSGKKVVLLSGDEEYRSEELVQQLGKILAEHHGFDCIVLYAIDPNTGEIDPCVLNNIPGLENLDDADVAVMFLRFRDLPDQQMEHIGRYLMQGKPILGIRTSTHAFNIPAGKKFSRYSFNHKDRRGLWTDGFGRLVLGETWINHHGEHAVEATRGVRVPHSVSPIVNGCEDVFGPTDVYTVRLPLPDGCVPVLLGQVLSGMSATDQPVSGPKNDPMMPIAWTKPYQLPNGQVGKAFTSTMGCAKDMESEGFRRLLVNATYWLAGLEEQIPDRANVAIVGDFEPLSMGYAKFKKGQKP